MIAESKVEVQAASNRIASVKLDYDGTLKLYEATKSVSTEDLLKKELEYTLAKAELQRLLIEEKREDLEYRMAAAQLERRKVKAPFDGVITKLHVEVGESCRQQQPFVRMVDVRQCYFITHVESPKPWHFTVAMPVSLHLQGQGYNIRLPGRVHYISPVVDPASGLQEICVIFENPDGKVRPGVTGKMTLAAGDDDR